MSEHEHEPPVIRDGTELAQFMRDFWASESQQAAALGSPAVQPSEPSPAAAPEITSPAQPNDDATELYKAPFNDPQPEAPNESTEKPSGIVPLKRATIPHNRPSIPTRIRLPDTDEFDTVLLPATPLEASRTSHRDTIIGGLAVLMAATVITIALTESRSATDNVKNADTPLNHAITGAQILKAPATLAPPVAELPAKTTTSPQVVRPAKPKHRTVSHHKARHHRHVKAKAPPVGHIVAPPKPSYVIPAQPTKKPTTHPHKHAKRPAPRKKLPTSNINTRHPSTAGGYKYPFHNKPTTTSTTPTETTPTIGGS